MRKSLMATALLVATAAAPLAASAQNYDYGHRNGGYNNGGYNNGGNYGSSTQGTIASVRGSNIQLTDGRNIFLHNGTVINPTGTSLQPGQRINVSGSRGGNGAINADQINVNGYGNNGNNGNGGWNNGNGRNGNYNDRNDRDRNDRDDNNGNWHRHHHDDDNHDNR